MEIDVREATLDDQQVRALALDHVTQMRAGSPPGQAFALDLTGLDDPAITLFGAWRGDELLGIGALKRLGAEGAEIKSMRTASDWLRRGVGDAMMRHLLGQAEVLAFSRLSLETGSAPAYAPARRLYARHGFVACGPFADYVADPHSQFMTRRLDAAGPSLTG